MSSDRHVELVEQITAVVARLVAAEGLELVELHVRGPSRKRMLRADIDRAGPRPVDLADCQRISHVLGRNDEIDALIPGSYVLEVSSPGIDRPIRTDDDVRRNSGRRVVVTTAEPLRDRREFIGLLLGGTPGHLSVRPDGEEEAVEIPLSGVLSARQDIGF